MQSVVVVYGKLVLANKYRSACAQRHVAIAVVYRARTDCRRGIVPRADNHINIVVNSVAVCNLRLYPAHNVITFV